MASQAFKKHTTLPKFSEDIATETGPIPLSYSLKDLSQMLVSNAFQPTLPKLTEAQRQLITDFSKDDFYSKEVVKSKLTEFFDILDDTFYFGLLKHHLDLDFRIEPTGKDEMFENHEGVSGFSCDHFLNDIERGERTADALCPTRITSIDPSAKPRLVLFLFHSFNQASILFLCGTLGSCPR